MASGSPCVSSNSGWDQPKASVLQDTPPASGSRAPQGGVEMAVAAAARINAMLMAQGKLKPLQPLPSKAPPTAPPPVSTDTSVTAEVDINDVPQQCRNLLTQTSTHQEIWRGSGAVVTTKGPCASDAAAGAAGRVYLLVQGRCAEDVNKGVSRIKQLIAEEVQRCSGVMPTVPVYRQPLVRTPSHAHKPAPPHQGSFVHTKLFVGLEPSPEVKERVEGPSGSYLQHVQSETGSRVFLRGRGSGYMEQASRRESFEPLYLYISHPNTSGLHHARRLCQHLLDTVRADYARKISSYTSTAPPTVYPQTVSYTPSWGSYSSGSAVQYPVCPRPFPPQEAAEGGSAVSLETVCDDITAGVVEERSGCERTMMPPPAAPPRKRRREERVTSGHTADDAETTLTGGDSTGSSALVPYGGDSSDEEEERVRGWRKGKL